MAEVSNVHFGRKAEIGVRSLNFRYWLLATDWRIVIYVGFTSSTGHFVAEIPFLSEQDPPPRPPPRPDGVSLLPCRRRRNLHARRPRHL